MLFVGHLSSFERGTWHYVAPHQQPTEGLDLGWRHSDGLLARVGLARVGLARSGTSVMVEIDSGHWLGNPYALIELNPLVPALVSLVLLALAAFVLQGRPWRELRAGLPAVAWTTGLWFGSLLFAHLATLLLNGLDRSMVSVAASTTGRGSADELSSAVYRELLERGFTVHAEFHARLVDVPSGANLAELVVLKAAPGSPFERWELTWKGPRRLQPHLVLRIVSDLSGARAAIEVDGGMVERSGPEEGQWRAWLDDLLAEAASG